MPYQNLREFLARLETAGELACVKVEVETDFEVAAVCRRALDKTGPAVMFQNLKGHTVPLVSNLFARRERIALALETTLENLTSTLIERGQRLLPPKIVKDGPCKERVFLGQDVDLFRYPIPIWSEGDGGRFLTLPCDISKDPVTGERNAGIYRSQVFERNKIGIHGFSVRHMFRHWVKSGEDKPFPIAIAMGCDPAIHIASATPLPLGMDEIALAGGLRGEPVEMVPCETIPLEVPAHAEIVLEGFLQPETRLEGPFGDYLGYYDPQSPCPIMEITAITQRAQPIMLASFEGRPPHDNALLNSVMYEAELMKEAPLPGLRGVHVTDTSAGFTAIVAVEHQAEGYARMMGLGLLGTWPGRHIKTLIIIDGELDPHSPADVDWSLSTRFQPHRDAVILDNLIGSPLDPSISSSQKGLSSKIILDASRSGFAGRKQECRMHPEVWERVIAQWPKYGI